MCVLRGEDSDVGIPAFINMGATGRPRARTQSSASDTKPMEMRFSVTVLFFPDEGDWQNQPRF
jgi:hypothetical protein